MRWFGWIAVSAVGFVVIMSVIGSFAPERYREQARQKIAARRLANPAPIGEKRLPSWIKSFSTEGDVTVITVDITNHWPDLIAGTFGKRVIDIAEGLRDGDIPESEAKQRILVYGNVTLYDQDGQNPVSETVLRTAFSKIDLMEVKRPQYNERTVFKAAKHTSQTAISRRNQVIGKLCETSSGADYGDLCSHNQ